MKVGIAIEPIIPFLIP